MVLVPLFFATNLFPKGGFLAGDIRVKADCDPLGCVGDLAWYTCRLSEAVFDWQSPVALTCHAAAKSAENVPIEAEGCFFFKSDDGSEIPVNWVVSFTQPFQQEFCVSGTLQIFNSP